MVNWEENLDSSGMYFILAVENTGKRYEKKSFLKKWISPNTAQPISDFDAKRGTLYEKAPNEKQPNNKSMVGLVSVEKSDTDIYSLDVQMDDIIRINFKELKLLLAINTNAERLATVRNKSQFERAYLAEAGDIVLVKTNFCDTKYEMEYAIIKVIRESSKGNGHYFYVSFKVNYLAVTKYL